MAEGGPFQGRDHGTEGRIGDRIRVQWRQKSFDHFDGEGLRNLGRECRHRDNQMIRSERSVLAVDIAVGLVLAGGVAFWTDLGAITFLPEPGMAAPLALHLEPGLLIQFGVGNEHREHFDTVRSPAYENSLVPSLPLWFHIDMMSADPYRLHRFVLGQIGTGGFLDRCLIDPEHLGEPG